MYVQLDLKGVCNMERLFKASRANVSIAERCEWISPDLTPCLYELYYIEINNCWKAIDHQAYR